MDTRTRAMRKAKDKSILQSKELANKKATRKPPEKSTKIRVPLQDMSTNIDAFDPKLSKCTVVLTNLSAETLKSPLRRLSQCENIYDFEESPSQEEIIVPNDEMNEILKDLEKKNIAKVAKRKPKVEKQKNAKTTVKTASKKRKATETTTKSTTATAAKKKKTHNLSAIATDEIGGNKAVTNNDNNDETYSIHSVCSDIIDQHGEIIGLIEKDWSKKETRTLRPRKANADDVTKASSPKVNNNKVKIVDTIELFEVAKKPIEVPIEESYPYIPNDVWDSDDVIVDSMLPESPPEIPSKQLKQPRRAVRNKPEQSTPKPSRAQFNESDIFKNASPLAQNESNAVASVSSSHKNYGMKSIEVISNIEITNQENDTEPIEQNASKGAQPKLRVYGSSPLKNISNSMRMNSSSSALFDIEKNSEISRDSTTFSKNMTVARTKIDIRDLKGPIVETEAPTLDNLFGFDDDCEVIEQTIELEPKTTVVSDKNSLAEKRKSLKRFLKNPEPKPSTKTSPRKRRSSVKAIKTVDIFGETNNVQRDIRSALQSHKNDEETVDHPNLFSDTETEITQDRRKSYTRSRKQYKRPLVADSEHEDDENDEVEESIEKKKKYKVKPRKKQVDPKEKSTEEEELDKFAEEFNSHCQEVEQFEVPVVPE